MIEITEEEIKEIDTWISSLSLEEHSKVTEVVKVLKTLSDLRKNTTIKLPYEAFDHAGIDRDTQDATISALWRNYYIEIALPPTDQDKSLYTLERGVDKFWIDKENTEVWLLLNNSKFEYLHKKITRDPSKSLEIPSGRHYIYDHGELKIRLKDNSSCTLDLSNADLLRPVFESFYTLYIETGDTLFSREQLLQRHKKLTKQEITWETFVDRKGSVGKMINKKPAFKSRLKWTYNKALKKYNFDILPLSDK